MGNKEFLNNPKYIYDGNDLGVNYNREKTFFRVWSPLATRMQVLIYPGDKEPVYDCIYEMEKSSQGTWYIELEGDFAGKYYTYQVYHDDGVYEFVDPYAKCTGSNSKRALIVNLEQTNPAGWKEDKRVKLDNYVDAVIYELHVRDFSTSPHSGIKNKGKYLAFSEKGTQNSSGLKTGIDHLKELGVTHIHLLPVFDFASVDDENKEDYNWGYDPLLYNIPEGSYASNPEDESRIKEFKIMVKSLHEQDIGVIMDVVYNHTYHQLDSPFNLLVPDYYYRFNYHGQCSNGSGCGNEIATERPMVRKFILDSVRYWIEEYHIDGFRFDLMALIDKETMRQIEKSLHNLDSSILIYGEPWLAGDTTLPPEERMTRGQKQELNIAVFNDHFRNAIKGDNEGSVRGFVSGAKDRENAIKKGIVGGIDYSEIINNFCKQPKEAINYVSSHDNLTLWDKLQKSNPEDDEIMRIKMDKLAQAIIMTAQGIPFIAGGEEFLRTKFGEHNSYNSGDKINQLKWERKTEYFNTYEYYRDLIKLRKKHPAFHMNNTEQIKIHLDFLKTPVNTVGFVIKGNANGDIWQDITVLYNPNRQKLKFNLPCAGEWKVVVNDRKAGVEILSCVNSYQVEVNSISAMVLYKNS